MWECERSMIGSDLTCSESTFVLSPYMITMVLSQLLGFHHILSMCTCATGNTDIRNYCFFVLCLLFTHETKYMVKLKVFSVAQINLETKYIIYHIFYTIRRMNYKAMFKPILILHLDIFRWAIYFIHCLSKCHGNKLYSTCFFTNCFFFSSFCLGNCFGSSCLTGKLGVEL